MAREERRSAERPTRRQEGAVRPDAAPFRRRDDPHDSASEAWRGEGTRRPDESIREEVLERLDRHDEVDASEIEVLVEAGEVTLQGTVTDRDMRWLAEGVAEAVAGVSLVHNRLRLARP